MSLSAAFKPSSAKNEARSEWMVNVREGMTKT